jgi:hypothetical protein
MSRTERLQNWINTLNEQQKNVIILELVDYAIDSEYVNFPNASRVPYFDSDGETLDGTEQEWED